MLVLSALLALVSVADAKKPKEVAPTWTPGWNAVGTAGGQCYYPPDFASMGPGDRRLAWNTARHEMMAQWGGQKGDGIQFDEKAITNTETALLAKAERVEEVAKANFEQCRKAFSGGGTGDWKTWLDGLSGQLTVGECPSPPLDYQLYDYLNVNAGWQVNAGVCKGDRVQVSGSSADYYQLEAGGPWVNADGDPNGTATGSGMPCTIEGCKPGMLVLQFRGMSGITTVVPIGTGSIFTAPEHGSISVMINDNNLSDNKYKVESRIEHHMQIEYGPPPK